MPTSAKGFVTPAGNPDDNDNLSALQAVADRLDSILTARTAVAINALAGVELWEGRIVRQTTGTGTAERQQSGPYVYDPLSLTWEPVVGDGLGGTATGPVLTAVTTNPVLGTGGSSVWDWWMMGDWLIGELQIIWGSPGNTPGSGELMISLPVLPAAFPGVAASQPIPLGHGTLFDVSADQYFDVSLFTQNGPASTGRLVYHNAVANAKATGAAPLTLGAAGDSIKLSLMYLT